MREFIVFRTALGWMGLIGQGQRLEQLTFGHASARQAHQALDPQLLGTARRGNWNPALAARLKAYAAGEPDDFADVSCDPGATTGFRRRVLDCCRRIPYGKTLTYGQLATAAGSPAAARAVGNCMAANRIPLIIPCHRVVSGTGELGGYSGVCGTAMKRRLLAMEARVNALPVPRSPSRPRNGRRALSAG